MGTVTQLSKIKLLVCSADPTGYDHTVPGLPQADAQALNTLMCVDHLTVKLNYDTDADSSHPSKFSWGSLPWTVTCSLFLWHLIITPSVGHTLWGLGCRLWLCHDWVSVPSKLPNGYPHVEATGWASDGPRTQEKGAYS